MKPVSRFILVTNVGVLCAMRLAFAQDFAVIDSGIYPVSGSSTGGEYAVSSLPARDLKFAGGDFVVAGGFRTLLAPSVSAPSGEELIVNGSFEDVSTFVATREGLMTLGAGSSGIPGWKIQTGEVVWINNTNRFKVYTPFGDQCLDLTGYSGPNAAMTQTIATTPGQRYRLSLALGSDNDYPGGDGRKSISICAGTASTVFTFLPTQTQGNEWKTFTLAFNANTTDTEIVIFGISPGIYLGLDNVSVVQDRSGPAGASENLVVNGSFEQVCPFAFVPDGFGIMSIAPGLSVIPGWTTVNAELAWAMNGNAFGPGSPYGALFLDLTGYHDNAPYGGITQTIPTTPGRSYRLSFAVGANQDKSAYSGAMTVGAMAGSVSNSFTLSPQGSGDQWAEFSMDFQADTSLTPIALSGVKSTGGGYLGLDNVVVAPATAAPLKLDVALPPLGESLQLKFISLPGVRYSVQSSDTLFANSWANLPETERVGTGGPVQLDLPRPPIRQRFYRLQMQR